MLIDTINARVQELETQMTAIKAAVEKEDRLLTEDEAATLEKSQTEHSELTRQAKLLGGVVQAKAATSEPVRLTRPALSTVTTEMNGAKKTTGGFKNSPEFYQAIKNAAMGRMDNRLFNAASDTSTEGTPADGGYAVPTDFRRDIWSYVIGQGSFLQLTDQYNSFSNIVNFPTDLVQGDAATYAASWTAETGSIAEKKIALGTFSVTAQKLAVAVNASEELLEDALAAQSFITRKAGESFQWAINKAIFSGTGVGQPTGAIVGSQYLLTPTGSAGTGVVRADHVLSMFYKMPQQNRGNAVWVVSPEVEAVLPTLVLSGTTVPAFQPPGGLSNSPYGTLLGRPVMASPHASSIGTVGDISLIDFSKYAALVKSPGIKNDVSMHVYFLNDVQTFRFTMRLGGKPWLSALTSFGGKNYSPFVGLAAR